MFEHLGNIVDRAEAGGLRPDQAAAVGEALAGQHAVFIRVPDALVLAEQIADLLAANAEIARRHVDVRTDVAVQLGHKRLTEAHDLVVAAAAGIEVGAALAAADGQARQAVLKRLLKGQKLHDRQVDGRMKPESALVRADRAVVLHAVAAVDMRQTGIVLPDDAEADHALRLHHALEQGGPLVFGVALDHRLQRGENLLHRLQELRFARILGARFLQYPLNVCVHFVPPES